MNDEQLDAAFYHLIAIGQLVLPYSLRPGSKPGGVVEGIGENEVSWLNYTWNPPQFLSHTPYYAAADPDASDKPTYAELLVASGQGQLVDLRKHTLIVLKEETQRRIILAYGAASFDNEIMLRLRGDSTTEQNTERDRLRQVYKALKIFVNILDLNQLQTLDIIPGIILQDAIWASN